MKVELDDEILYQIKDAVMVEFLKDDLDTIKKSLNTDWHEDDTKFDKKLIKAYKLILKYYGVTDDWVSNIKGFCFR